LIPSEVEDYLAKERKTQEYIITASSILIAVPLVALSFFSTNSAIPKLEISIVAVLEVASAVTFSVSLFLMILEVNNSLKPYAAIGAISMFGRMTPETLAEYEKATGIKPKDILDKAAQSLRRDIESPKSYGDWGLKFFLVGLFVLACSLVSLAAALIFL
jgi:hypothetical protein